MAPRVAVVAPSWLGDAVMALPAIGDVRRAFPESALVIVARRFLAPLFRSVGGVDEVVEWRGSGGLAAAWGWRDDAGRLATARADIAILLPNSFASAWVVRHARVPERWGYRVDLRRGLLTRAVSRPRGSRHQSEYYRQLVAALGMDTAGPPLPVRVSEEEAARARQLLIDEGWQPGGRLIGLAPGAANGHAKRWPPESYAALVRRISAGLGATAVLVGSASDVRTAAEIERWLRRARVDRADPAACRVRWVNLVGRTDLSLAMAVTASCQAFVSNDSGAMHLAAALGVPVVAIFGPTIERETAPLPPDAHTVLTNPVWCRPCMLRECPIDHRCMTGIPVERVAEAVRVQLRRGVGSG